MSRPPTRPSARLLKNQDQTALALHLVGVMRDRLAGRDALGQELVDVRPRERVVLGVLQPQLPPPATPPVSGASVVPHEPGVPVDHLPASEIGLSALVEPESPELVLHVRSRYALYVQHAPAHAQQAAYSGLIAESPQPPEPLPDEESFSGDDATHAA